MQDDNDADEFESLDQEVDNEAEERQRQAAAEARAKQAKQDQAPEDNAETVTTASWLGSRKYSLELPEIRLHNQRVRCVGLHFIRFELGLKLVNN